MTAALQLEDGNWVRLAELSDASVDGLSCEQWRAVEGELAWAQLQRATLGGASSHVALTAGQVGTPHLHDS